MPDRAAIIVEILVGIMLLDLVAMLFARNVLRSWHFRFRLSAR